MTSIPKFDSEIYSEEIAPVTSEREYDEVMQASAVEDEAWQAYEQWSQETEESAWQGSKSVNTAHGQILIKKACEHPQCSHLKCERGLRIGGVEV